jgi:hypothetical protein
MKTYIQEIPNPLLSSSPLRGKDEQDKRYTIIADLCTPHDMHPSTTGGSTNFLILNEVYFAHPSGECVQILERKY